MCETRCQDICAWLWGCSIWSGKEQDIAFSGDLAPSHLLHFNSCDLIFMCKYYVTSLHPSFWPHSQNADFESTCKKRCHVEQHQDPSVPLCIWPPLLKWASIITGTAQCAKRGNLTMHDQYIVVQSRFFTICIKFHHMIMIFNYLMVGIVCSWCTLLFKRLMEYLSLRQQTTQRIWRRFRNFWMMP